MPKATHFVEKILSQHEAPEKECDLGSTNPGFLLMKHKFACRAA
jgi:hypothetical protein